MKPCRYCQRPIKPYGTLWIDGHGYTVCTHGESQGPIEALTAHLLAGELADA